ncbi:hypothetical protein ACIBJC_05665 [Streptomyces sp. NPDC050509]|uniref:hypothetical protein n=1 Tax=Streptomyces sp. NPDC050509 TaxID=3365620 RepID=UPI0037A8FBE7
MTDRVLEVLRARPELADLAAFPFNFDVNRAYHVEVVRLASGASLEPIAGDDTGGTYFLCGGTAVLHASSEGSAVLLADSVGEALEVLVRLPWWCEELSADLGEEDLLAAVRAADDAAREEFAPELDAWRAALIRGLGLPDRPLTELLARSESAALRTDPDHVLLNSRELRAYRLDESCRRPLREIVLGPGAPEEAGAENEFTWIEPAVRQGLGEHARIALIRLLDDTGPDADRLRELSRALERVGDHAQAARAQAALLALRDTAWDRASAAYALARLERRTGDLAAAGRALEQARAAVGAGGGTPDATVVEWHRRGLGRLITEQHLELVLAAVEAGDTELARATMAHARLLLGTIGKESAKALSRLSTRAKWAVAGDRPSGA